MNNKFGFIPSNILEEEHYYLGDGSLNPPVIAPDSQWDGFLPTDDLQNKNGLETMNCTNYGTLHILATLGKRKFGAQFQTNLSERYTGVMTGTTLNGNDPHKVIEIIRTISGVVPAVFLPFDGTISTWFKYYNPNPINYSMYAIGAHWLKKYKVSHQWIFLSSDTPLVRQQKMKQALQYSPLGVSGYAWAEDVNGLCYSLQPFQNHWFEIYGYVDGQYWKVFDSYDNTHKKLEWNYTFGQCKGYGLDFNVGGQELGDNVEPVYFKYATYYAGQVLSNLIK